MPVFVAILIVSLAATLVAPCRDLAAQVPPDSTGMPSLELLAREAGRESRRHPIRSVAHTLLCEAGHPLVDSASTAACAALDSVRAAAITTAFAHGLDVPLSTTADSDAVAFPICPRELDRVDGSRVLLARVTAPVVGMREGRWEGRITVELRCRPPTGGEVRTMGKEYLYEWDGRAWRLYQHAWWRSS